MLLVQILSVSAIAQTSQVQPALTAQQSSYDFEFSGVYTWGDVITTLCRDGYCRTQLPRPFFEMSVPLNVYEKTFDGAFKALSLQAKADGYILKKTGKKEPFLVIAELDEERQATYISCLDTSVRKVAATDLYRYKLADSLKCASRVSSRDSLKKYRDSLSVPIGSSRYRVSFYVVSSSFVRGLGIEWTSIWAQGDLTKIPTFITEWTLKAVADDDTTAEFRSVELDVDSIATLHWGSQRKEEKSTIVYSNGVSQQDWEWRNYGLTLTLTRTKQNGIRGDYSLAQRDENNSVLKGNFGGGGQDSIVAYGVYDSYQNGFYGIPWLSRIPVIGYLFGHETHDKVKSFFVIQIYKVQRDTVFHSFSYNDSLRVEDIKKYEQVDKDSSSSDVDTLGVSSVPDNQ